MESTEKPSLASTLQSQSEDGNQGTAEGKATSTRSLLDQTTPIFPEDSPQKYLTGLKLLATMVSVTLVGFLMLLDTSIVATAIPRITDKFHSLDDVGWYGTAYLLANCALQPLTGKIYTLFSNKRTFLSFFAVFELGSLICGVANSSKMLIVGRAIAGMGASGLLNGGYTILDASVVPSKKAALLGIVTGGAVLGLLLGPVLGGILTQYASWRWCFYINLPSGAVVLFLLLFITLPDHNGKEVRSRRLGATLRRLDLIGFALFAGFSIQILIALNWGGSKYPWNSSVIIGLFPGAAGALCAFCAWESYMGDQAMIPYSLIRRRVVWSSCINYGFFAACLLATEYYLPIYFQATRQTSPTMSGVNLLPSILGTMLFSMVTGILVQRVGYYLPFAIASGVLTMLGSGLLSTLDPNTSRGKWTGYQILTGVGRGCGLQMPVLAAQHNSSPGEVSIVTGLIVFSQQFGGAVFLSLAQVIFSSSLREKLAFYAPDVDSSMVVAVGATDVREVVSPASLPGVLVAYSKACDQVLYLATGAAGGALLFSFGMGWVNIKKKDGAAEAVNEKDITVAP